MYNENIIYRIALLQEQIYNLEKSGHFTEKEMDSQTFTLRSEIEALQSNVFPLETVLGVSEQELEYLVETLKDCLSDKKTTPETYGMTAKSYTEGARKHTLYFSQMPSPALLNTWKTLDMAITRRTIVMAHLEEFPEPVFPENTPETLKSSWNTLGRNLAISKG
jgi:hypothetical protein